MRTRPNETKTLAVKLTEDELKLRATSLAETTLAIEQREQLAKDIAAEHKKEVDKSKVVRSVLARTVRTGKEDQPVECVWGIEHRPSREGVVRRVWVLRSTLTDEEVTTEATVPSDFQEEIPFETPRTKGN